MTENWTTPVMSPWQRRVYKMLIGIWLFALVWFWVWWLQPDHSISWEGMLLSSGLLGWTVLLPGWFFFFAARMRRPNPLVDLPAGSIAMVVTKAPKEPWPVVRRTLEAMRAQRLPGRSFDVWLADEDPSRETRDWCLENGVQLSCRLGVAGYNNPTWPGRAKCKEGNLRYFYELAGGYARYDFVVQLDADHVPTPTYLANMIQPFADPGVGYVAAPSICDNNAASSWAARGRLHAEATLHGPLQAGYYGGFAPLCIGSHYAVRTRALQQVGGLGPELAEDHSTTLALVASGWRGGFAFDAIAHGDGPSSMADAMTQEYQWSRSLMRILLSFTPFYWSRLNLKARIEFGFAQLWYPLFAMHLLAASFIPPIALLTRLPWVSVSMFAFLAHSWILTWACLLPVAWIQRRGWCRPATAPVVSWESVLFQVTRWPWVLLGVTHAIVGHMLRREFDFRVTPKSPATARALSTRLVLPYAAMVSVQAGALVLTDNAGRATGYYWLGLMTTLVYATVVVAVVALHVRESLHARYGRVMAFARTVLNTAPVTVASTVLLAAAVALRGHEALVSVLPLSPASVALLSEGATQVVLVAQAAGDARAVEEQFAVAPLVSDSLDRTLNTTRPPWAPDAIKALDLPADGVTVGAYDPELRLPNDTLKLEHWYARQDNPVELAAALKHAQNRRAVMVTIEPYSPAWDASSPVLDRINQGLRDADLRELARTVAGSAPQTVLVRWGHEMELSGQYPWAANDPAMYRAAFRHVVSIFRAEFATNARFVWSPAGNAGADAYYPGDDVVDCVGLTVLDSEQWDAADHLRPQSFTDVFGPKYNRVAQFGKPVIVAELGVSGTAERQLSWLRQAAQSLGQFPQLRAVVYFNARSPWPGTSGVAPDWRIGADVLGGSRLAANGRAEGN